MNAIYFYYGFVVQVLKHRGVNDLRFTPFLLISLMLHPVINSILGVVVSSRYERVPIEVEDANFYTRVDIWFYLAMALTFLLVWLVLDARRVQITSRIPSLQATPLFKFRYMVIVGSCLFAVILSYLSHINSWVVIGLFAGITLIASVFAKPLMVKS